MKKNIFSFKNVFGKIMLCLVFLGLLALPFTTAQANTTVTGELTGRVVSVIDGDTVTVLTEDNVQHRIRLNGIDAPEKYQAFGGKARQHLGDLVYKKEVTVTLFGKDKYGRDIGQIATDELDDVNAIMIQDGFAWHYVKYYPSAEYAALQEEAQDNNRGLWADSNPIPPWEFRKWKRNK